MKSFLQYRKTALLVCAVLCSFFVVHLVGAYIYSGGKYVGLPGGGVSVGVVSDSNPNPLNHFCTEVEKLTIHSTIFFSEASFATILRQKFMNEI